MPSSDRVSVSLVPMKFVDVAVEGSKDYKRGLRTGSHTSARDGIDLAHQAWHRVAEYDSIVPDLQPTSTVLPGHLAASVCRAVSSSRKGHVIPHLKHDGRRRKIWWLPKLKSWRRLSTHAPGAISPASCRPWHFACEAFFSHDVYPYRRRELLLAVAALQDSLRIAFEAWLLASHAVCRSGSQTARSMNE